MARRAHRGLLAALAAACACAHSRPATPVPAPDVVWPEAPAEARVRFARELPDPAAPAPRASWWRRVLDAIAGMDRDARAAEERLARPFGVTALADGSVLVTDPDKPAVLRIDARGIPAPIACRDREWSAPMAAVDGPDGAIYVADGGSGDIVRVDATGCRALGAGLLQRPTGLVAAEGRLYVVDPPRHEVVVLGLGGELVARFGTRGESDGQLQFPSAIARAADGTLLVVDALNFRVARFSPQGEWLGAFGVAGDQGAEFSRPKGIAVDGEGRIYVSDAQRDLVLVFGPDGTFECALGAGGAEPGHLTMPAGVAVAQGRLYVADSQNHRVQVFEFLGGRP